MKKEILDKALLLTIGSQYEDEMAVHSYRRF